MKIVVEGNLSSFGSYGIVNLNLGRALSQRGHEVAFVGLDISPDELSRQILGADFAGLNVSVGEPNVSSDVRIRQIWPPIWVRRRREERLVVIQPWEFGSIPISWIDGIDSVDAIWVPSEYCKRGYIQSGVDPAKVWVVPNGFDSDEIAQEPLSQHERVRFLFLGGTIFRKGIDVLVDALDILDDTTLNRLDLVVKDVGADSFYSKQSLLESALASHPRVHARTFVERRHIERGKLLKLIADSDALVHPYRAEGFGMTILEAMAMGTPVIHTLGGATNEFCGPGESLLVPSSLRVADQPRVGETLLSDKCYWMEPSPEQLGQIISNFVDGSTETRALVQAAKCRAHDLSWARVAEIAEVALGGLSSGIQPGDSLSGLAADLSHLLEVDSARPAPILSRLVAVGDIGTAFRLAAQLEQKADVRESVDIASVRERLSSVALSTPDVWSGGPYRALVGAAEFEKVGYFGFVHDFEGGDQATYAIAQYLSNYLAGCKEILDLACGQGSMLRVLRGQGKLVQGVEADPTLVRELRADGFTIHQGYIPSDLNDFDFGTFDGVFLGHIVEHLDPSEFEKLLDWIYENITGQGTVLIQTPDFANSGVGLENFWLDASHVRPYPIRLLKAMLSKTGFVPIEGGCRRVPEIAPLDVIALARRLPLAPKVRTRSSQRAPRKDLARVGHYALFNGTSGFAEASRFLFDYEKLRGDGIEVTEFSVNQPSGGEPLSARPTVPIRFSERVRNDIAIVDVPVGWLADVSSRARANYRIARTTFEANPLSISFQRAASSFDEVWCFSHYDAAIFANSGIPAESIISIPPGIEIPRPEVVRALRASLVRNSFRFMSVFNFEPRKNPEALVKAFSIVVHEVPRSELVVKLSGITVKDFSNWLCGILSPAELAGIKDRMQVIADNLSRELLQQLYLNSDVFVLPTRGEGYGLPFLEALAHGLPTICPDIGGHREFCNEGNSLLVKTSPFPASVVPGAGVFFESFWREVEVCDLAARMIEAATNSERLAGLSESGIADAAGFGVAACQAAARNRLAQVVRTM